MPTTKKAAIVKWVSSTRSANKIIRKAYTKDMRISKCQFSRQTPANAITPTPMTLIASGASKY
jgi:hypothetical protein